MVSSSSRRVAIARTWHALLLCIAITKILPIHSFLFPTHGLISALPHPPSTSTRHPSYCPSSSSSTSSLSLSLSTKSCASFSPTKAAISKTSLNYASRASADPMEQVDSNKGGCPFLDTSYVYKTYEVPALFSATDSRPIVLFDGNCNLCNKFVQTLLKYDSCSDDDRGNLRFAALQSRVGDLLVRRMSEDLRAQVVTSPLDGVEGRGGVGENGDGEEKYKSIVVCDPEKTYIRSSAVFQILRSLGGPSKRLKAVQYLALLGYVLPTSVRDRAYEFVSKRRKKWFGSSDECLLWDDRFEDRFVDDGVLTGTYRDPFADPNAEIIPTSKNLFEGESPPARGDRVRIIWPADSEKDPSVSYDDEFPAGICIIGGTGTISTIDLPMRVVMRVDRDSIGLSPDEKGEETMIAWVKPQEVAAM